MNTNFIISLIMLFSLSACNQTSLVFHPEKIKIDYAYAPNTKNDFEEIFFKTEDEQTLNGLFFPNDTNKVILYFHGNAGSLDSWQHIYKYYESLKINFFIIDYRGFGKSTGNINEDGLYKDAKGAYQYLIQRGFQKENIIVLGRSIGSGIAIDLASKNTINTLILESPFFDFETLAKSKVSIPIKSQYKFHNMDKINSIKCPILFMHGEKDNLIPANNSQKLYNVFTGKKELLLIPTGGHNNLPEYPEYSQAILLFLSFYK
jgi:fermentation-respiration switch protein FrsA (DUF1100 family)